MSPPSLLARPARRDPPCARNGHLTRLGPRDVRAPRETLDNPREYAMPMTRQAGHPGTIRFDFRSDYRGGFAGSMGLAGLLGGGRVLRHSGGRGVAGGLRPGAFGGNFSPGRADG